MRCSIGSIDLSDKISVLNVFRYITFRTGGAVITALLFVFLFGQAIIDRLRLAAGQGPADPRRTARNRTSSPRPARRPWAA